MSHQVNDKLPDSFLILGTLKSSYHTILLGTTDWAKFAQEWRMGYVVTTFVLLIRLETLSNYTHRRRIAAGGQGPSCVDVMHREVRSPF